MNEAFNYRSFMQNIIEKIKKETDIETISQGSKRQGQEYPFFSYDFINPHVGIHITDNTEHELFEMVIEFDAHVTDVAKYMNDIAGITGATQLANQLYKLFNSHEFYIWALTNGFVVIETEDINETTNLLSEQVERSAGFQVKLRTLDNFVDNKDYIQN